ncbi:sn-glycerol-3-phosphate ABC transporter ATP-binding protein UgpC [Hahella sp. KA22]|uniref:ABC transporter ATP-binding protein n=1 Tax=Hahella sp. KA22 TaxID=1628392 RepID=UPI000FDF3B5D|nr:ABC transporter ATP-binding protein [Hahella sp. KA22]AZZ94147.1 ABC transporter ATP-binding protein [Hahella sp. KA22]QAY57521.1 sn-glycerol-3-phosphate ABC transporter ATP-binding protein UgpC [Hahella sp. KA22]
MSYLNIKDLHKHYDQYHAIRGVNLEIQEGEFIVFVGPSGCGKSTLLRLIAGLELVSEGSIHLDGRDITEAPSSKRDLAMVFQSYALYPHMTVAENLSFALRLAKRPQAEIDEKVRSVAASLQLDKLLARKPRELSGGQRQRVAIGRAIVRQPKVFLFDEPLSNLDAALRVQMRLELARLHKQLGTTMIYVTHDQVEAMTLADRVVILNQGQIEQCGSPIDLYQQPANRFVAEFIGTPKMNMLAIDQVIQGGESVEVRAADAHLRLPARVLADNVGAGWSLGVRPEHIHIAPIGDGPVQGRIELIENLGSEAYCHVQVNGCGNLVVKSAARSGLMEGQQVSLNFDAEEMRLFNPQNQAVYVNGGETAHV